MKHQTGDWLAKWYCGNILHFHAFSLNYAVYDYRSQNNSPTLNRGRSILALWSATIFASNSYVITTSGNSLPSWIFGRKI